MNDHLTPEVLSALADGELAASDVGEAKAHLDQCLACANLAVDEWLLKTAVARAGHRYDMPEMFRDRMAGLIVPGDKDMDRRRSGAGHMSPGRPSPWTGFTRWAVAAVMTMALAGWGIMQYRLHSFDAVRAERTAMIAEVCDLHIATLAANQPPQVASSDRHTVKPWFQGKLPFSFNIPESLPADTTLDGADLAYLGNHPVAQLLFSIGRHRVSVFVEERDHGATALSPLTRSHSGFQVVGFETDDLEVIAVSDVDPARLQALTDRLKDAQARH